MSIPIPKAIVATTIASAEADHHSWVATRSSVLMPAWYGRARRPAAASCSATRSAVRWSVTYTIVESAGPLSQPLDERRVALGGRDRRRQQRQVRPVEAGDDDIRLLDAEPGPDVGDDGRCRGGGQREHALGCQVAGALGQLEVVGPEVVPPLGDAVRLVDREQRDPRPLELGEEALVVEALGRDVQEPQRALAEPLVDRALLRRVDARVEPCRVDPASLQEVDLVFHQRDQGRDDDRDPVEEQRRQLVADALAAPGREDGERRAPGEERLDHLLLARAKRAEAEPRLEHVKRRLDRCCFVAHVQGCTGSARWRGRPAVSCCDQFTESARVMNRSCELPPAPEPGPFQT